jgi:hypothetical protein
MPDSAIPTLKARLVGEIVEARAHRPARALGLMRLHHGRRGARHVRRLIGLRPGHVARGDGHRLLPDGDVAAQDQADPPKLGLGPRQLGESRGGREGAQPARDHLPAGLDELLVVDREESGIVVVGEHQRLAVGARQRAELRIADGALSRLVERAPDTGLAEVARLGAEADKGPGVRLGLEYHL